MTKETELYETIKKIDDCEKRLDDLVDKINENYKAGKHMFIREEENFIFSSLNYLYEHKKILEKFVKLKMLSNGKDLG